MNDERGASLTEVLIAAAIASVIATAFVMLFAAFSRNVSLEEARAGALGQVQLTMSELLPELRQAESLGEAAIVERLESAWPAAELVFHSDRDSASPGPERYRYYLDSCTATHCDLMRAVTVAANPTEPWVYTGTPNVELVVANILPGASPVFRGTDWTTGSAITTSSCDLVTPCAFSLVEVALRVDPDPNLSAESAVLVHHEVRLRNAG